MASIIMYLVRLLLVAATVASAQQTPASAPATQLMNTFTPIRLIQPQTQEQQQAIQRLIQELQRSSPQLFSATGQPGNQQMAIALPPELQGFRQPATAVASNGNTAQPVSNGNTAQPVSNGNTAQPAPAPTPEAPAPTPEAPAPTPEAPAPTPEEPASSPEAPAPSPEEPAPKAPVPSQAADSGQDVNAPTPLSFALDAMFRGSGKETSSLLPFGLHFDSSTADELGPISTPEVSSQESSMSEHQWTHHRHSSSRGRGGSGGETGSDSLDDWAGLDSSAATPAMSLVAIGLAVLSAVAAGV
ncbi:hypothetical protein GGF46_004671 [Coemansia sp. RSA 552]|nr:hypothetical protein GGF46_004671 [Coemansia sp. RSA 552]